MPATLTFAATPTPIFPSLEIAIAAKMTTMGELMLAESDRLVPVKTGALKRSLAVRYDPATRQTVLSAGVPYSLYIEWGTRYNRAQPYLRPTLAVARGAWT